MKTKSAIDQVEELAPRTLKEIVHGEAKTLRPKASVPVSYTHLTLPTICSV